MTFYEKIQYLCRRDGTNISNVAKELGIGSSRPTGWKNGLMPSAENVVKLAAYFKCSTDYLLSSDNIFSAASNTDLSAYGIYPVITKKIPLLGEIACGKPIFADEDRESYVSVGTDLKVDFCLTCRGDSMINARILDGDIVFIQQCDIVNNGEIAAVIIDDEATLKRVYYYPEKSKLVLQAENPKYEPLVYVGEELNQIRILGRAVAFQSDVK